MVLESERTRTTLSAPFALMRRCVSLRIGSAVS
jgi:hypothetical protein